MPADTPLNAPHPPLSLDIDFDTKKSLAESLLDAWQSGLENLKHSYITTAGTLIDEVLIKLSEEQVNDAFHRFVVDNVDMILNLRTDLHDEHLRLYCTVDFRGIFASVACNFRLVNAMLTADTQRFVFEQLSDTEILELHSKKWWQAFVARRAVSLYKTLMRRDPLGFILSKINVKGEPFASQKGNIIYLDIHRYLAKQKKILGTLKKVQVNDGYTQEDKLILRLQPNFAELLSFGDSGEDIITERDNPERQNTKDSDSATDNKASEPQNIHPKTPSTQPSGTQLSTIHRTPSAAHAS